MSTTLEDQYNQIITKDENQTKLLKKHSLHHLYDLNNLGQWEQIEIDALLHDDTTHHELSILPVLYYAHSQRHWGTNHPVEKHLRGYKHKSYNEIMKEIYGNIDYLFWCTLNELHKLRAVKAAGAHLNWKHVIKRQLPSLPPVEQITNIPTVEGGGGRNTALPKLGGLEPVVPTEEAKTSTTKKTTTKKPKPIDVDDVL